ncbi:RNA-directed DNA polymerase, eukaryota, reverse transcriptase zinc-binding domain protein [Tanacetum coccineum]
MFSSPNTLWVNTIKALHGQDGGLDNQGCNFNGIWSRIVGTSNFLHSKDIIPLNSFRFKVGCGTRIRFWKDIWIGDSPLLTRYNRLYRLDQDKDCLIIDRIVDEHWNWNWSRDDIGIRNTAYLRDLLMEISQVDISVDEDTCTWSLADDGIFSVRSSRRLIDSKLLPSIFLSTSWDNILPRKVNIFLWSISLHRLPHRLTLSSRGIDILTISCSSCNGNVESVIWLRMFGLLFVKSRCYTLYGAAFSVDMEIFVTASFSCSTKPMTKGEYRDDKKDVRKGG